MSDDFYTVVHTLGRPVFWVCSKPVALHVERTHRRGAYILVAPHLSPYDVPLLMRHTQRPLDFVSIIEVFRNRFIAWFYGNMNAFPHDRSKPDSPTVRTILERLRAGRVVAMFPEGGIRSLERSVLNGGKMRPGVGRLSQLSGAPVVPAVVLGSTQFGRFTAWLPLRRVRYGVIYGQPITVDPSLDKETASLQMEARLRASFALLYDELKVAMGEGKPA